MKKIILFITVLITIVNGYSQETSWTEVEKVFGKKGMVQGNVFKISFPRSDLKVSVNGFAVAPGLALGSWVGIIKMEGHSMMMGDLVLLDKEVEPAIKKLLAESLEVTALHNHLVGETPAIKYMHYSGSGDAVKLAKKIKAVLEVTGTPLTAAPASAEKADWTMVEDVLGKTGRENGKLLHYTFARNEKLTESNMEMPAAMGMATAINFQMEGDKAAATGDFVLLAEEVNAVVKTLTDNGIAVTAIHNHMLNDKPRLFMLHFWAVDEAAKLARGLKEALDKTNSKR